MINIRALARQTLQHIAEFVEDHMPEVEVEPGEEDVLIIDNYNRHFLLNYHGVTQQVWYSSAISGAHHFALTEAGVWHCTRSEDTLSQLLSRELSHICQRDINIPYA
ncbi:frataxin domain-containing protein [Candidatus Odyssella thessalonicensis]|uniref:frataxin domain-containing protein n=1 Tax=Candidatus Odyssella thessalonicensis TaxID=84647 RepID=UPI000225C173|nr:frataxin domain-containing protein [Candidatus Odyssella thessalonicensis]